jgi:hypothetical protein
MSTISELVKAGIIKHKQSGDTFKLCVSKHGYHLRSTEGKACDVQGIKSQELLENYEPLTPGGVTPNRVETLRLIARIIDRADKMRLLHFDRITLMMDLECANNEFNLRLEDFLNADDSNFAHDIVGIQNNIDRTFKRMNKRFVPRFTGTK